ncbi:unnamed protein product [Tuber melanosporum]|uniref:(Perigord truffle) hypothetical protein n=1 Tax=Tuber melanosporum (strain Mel28) TaxID=656061 RepID=D5GJB0_TUBMM|nr:uncharacterized protein GSTUM_00008918001 [Tuber melanosporum]CAZ84603.1 unnamed protein product [Tuber melanosporum]
MFISLSLLVYPLLALAAVPHPLLDHHLLRRHPEPRENPNEIQGVSPPERCMAPCTSVYTYAASGLITEPPQTPANNRPYGFDSAKLCRNKNFMEDAPHCIDCLFRTMNEVDWRSTLLNSYRVCVYELKAMACPRSCGDVDKMVEACRRIDAGEIEDPEPVDHALDPRTPPCVCKPKNRKAVMDCFECMVDWNAVLAQDWLKLIKPCNDWNDFPWA